MKNTLPAALPVLFSRAEDMADGCKLYETPIGLEHYKELGLRARLTSARDAQTAYQAARGLKLTAVEEATDADNSAKELIISARDVIKPHFGTSWSQAWVVAGFVNNSLAMPGNRGGRKTLVKSLETYFVTHPTHAVENAGVTAAALGEGHQGMVDAQAAVNAALADVGLKKALRDTEARKLRVFMRGTIHELKDLLPGDDARWRAFGLNPPDAVGLPDVPEGLTVVGSMPDHLFANWESAALSDRYRLYRKIMGVDNEYVLVKTVVETEADLNSMTSGQVVKVRVSSVNDAGESLMSEPVEITVP